MGAALPLEDCGHFSATVRKRAWCMACAPEPPFCIRSRSLTSAVPLSPPSLSATPAPSHILECTRRAPVLWPLQWPFPPPSVPFPRSPHGSLTSPWPCSCATPSDCTLSPLLRVMYFFVCLYIVLPPLLECQLQEGGTFLLLCPQCLKQCLAHTECIIENC